jgi:hypothetical protein
VNRPQRLLSFGAYANFGVALLHLMFIFGGDKELRYFGAPIWVFKLYHERYPFYVLLLVAVAGVFALFALYALSGAGTMRRLPYLRTGLVAIGALYALRGLLVIPEVASIAVKFRSGYQRDMQFPVMSLAALCVGLCYLLGVAGTWHSGEGGTRMKPTAARGGKVKGRA